MSAAEAGSDEAIQLRLDLWHPGCWVLDVVGEVDIGLLGYGIFTRDDGRATTRYTVYGDDRATIEAGIDLIRGHPSVYDVVPMTSGYRRLHGPSPGNARSELLVEHDGTTQISDAFTSRGFTYAAPCDTYGDSESWTLFANADRGTVRDRLDEIRNRRNARITVESISVANRPVEDDPLPIDRLSHRQREVFQAARKHGYYRHPTEMSAGELAGDLGITTSTFHEHLHKAEEKLLDLS